MNDIIAKDASKIEKAFKFFDTDNDGKIDQKDLKKILESDDNISIDDALVDDIVQE
jgi:Ca2+-binding EF-hand superfamily protein